MIPPSGIVPVAGEVIIILLWLFLYCFTAMIHFPFYGDNMLLANLYMPGWEEKV